MRPVVVLLNGLPGSGKSTLARAWCEEHAGALALDVDVLRSMLGRWRERPLEAGLAARAMALAATRTHLAGGHDVVVPQFLRRPDFADRLAEAAAGSGAGFLHAVVDVVPVVAEERLAARAAAGGGAAEGPLELALTVLHDQLEAFLRTRPDVVRLSDGVASLDRLIDERR